MSEVPKLQMSRYVHILCEQFNVIVGICQRAPSGEHTVLDKGLHYSGFTSPGITAGGGEDRSQGHRTEWLPHKWQLGQTGVLTNTPCTM